MPPDALTPVRFGLVGFGAWGSHHARAIAKIPGAELVAVAARSEATRHAAQAAYPAAAVYADYRELLARGDLDAVDVVLPSHLHHEVGSAVLAADKHLLIEKPLALSVADCDHLVELARRRRRLLAVGHELRASSLWGKVKELVEAGAVGEPRYVLVELSRRPYRLGADGWRYDIRRVGSWILEEPIHFFDLARWYLEGLGDPVSVFAQANSAQPGHPELHDNFTAIVNFPRGAYAVVSQTLAAFEHHQTVKLTGTEGALWASWSGAMDRTFQPTFWLKQFRRGDEAACEVPLERPSGEVYELEDELARFTAAVRGEAALGCTGIDGRWSVALCLAAEQSVADGAPVRLETFTGASR